MNPSTDSYKGVRDFYPHDAFIQDYILNTIAHVFESFGYERYDASVLESAELYRAKGAANEEMANKQTYTFEDRGGREVTLRPEMTPTVARMVAKRTRELSFPLRWYSLPNCFRYERTQKGRLREFWQPNADLFGIAGIDAEVEVIALAHALMTNFGASEYDFEIRINDRRVFEQMFDEVGLEPDTRNQVMSLLDRRAKIDNFETELEALVGDRATQLHSLLDSASTNPLLEDLRARLSTLDITNITIDTTIVRGFDYYTGMIFEVFDTASENSRSIAGGGRYDNLLELFGVEPVPTVGFAIGDVITRDFLETHDLLPEYASPTDLMLCVLDEASVEYAEQIAQKLRAQDTNVAINYSYKKAGEQIKLADKKGIPFVACIGSAEVDSGVLKVKHLASHEESEMAVDDISEYIFNSDV